MVNDNWLPQTEHKATPRSGQTLLVLDPRFFVVIGKQWEKTNQLSEAMLIEASELYERVVIVPTTAVPLAERLAVLVQDLELTNVVVDSEACRAGRLTAIEIIRKRIIEAGCHVRKVRNPREVHAHNVHKYLIGDGVVIVRADEHEKVGLTIDKERSFEDAVKERRSTSFW